MNLRPAIASLMSLCLLPLLGGCAEGDEVTVTTESVTINLRGTDARDTLDLNIGTNAGFGSDNGAGIFTGPEGQILLMFKQQHETPAGFQEIPQALTQPFNYARVLADTAGPIMPVDDHADPQYDNNIDFMRQSPNLRYVALLNQTEFNSIRLKLVVWDFTTGAFTQAAMVADSDLFARGAFSSNFLFAQDLFVDNSGRVTVIFQAIDQTATDDTDRSLWAMQYDTGTQLITRAPTIISGAFLLPGDSSNGADYVAGRIAANGDIAILLRKTDNYGGAAAPDFRAVLHSVVYKAATNTWGPATRADNGLDDRFGSPVGAPQSVVLDTDANSFQYAFVQNSDGFGGNLPAVYTSRFVASAGTAFPVPTRLDTTGPATLHRVADPQGGGGVDIHFGRNGASLVHWVQTETGQFSPIDTIWASHSSNTVAPASANSAELLNASMPAQAGYTITTFRAVLTAQPAVAFDDAGNAIIAFRAINNDATADGEVYVATFNGTTITPATPGTGNLATQPAVAAGQTRSIQNVHVSGFSGGANPTCFVAWQTELTSATAFLGSGAWGVVYSGLAAAGPAVLVSASSNTNESAGIMLASSNRFSSCTKAEFGIVDPALITDEYPAYGNGTVWLLSSRLTPPATPTGSNSYEEIRVSSFNPAVHTNVVSNGSSVTTLGQVDHPENWSMLSDGSLDIAFGVFGYHFQRSYAPSSSAGADPFATATQLLTPPDMKQVSSSFEQGVHVDGMNFIRTAGGGGVVSTFVNVPRRWTLWMAQDTKSQRIFGVRSR